ncbi:Mitochondrial inheritance and actin cytoskeleton organization protein [Ceraceosorus bombacis]|uniref:Mitochondrial inheritance and actin cytoskeleton organization protein n=1 Tax=Ceraceosorus bombacis TaxID=401625 RepID=A0A0P1BS23_9BASI|nr:Mitochondrial inheritance and actin cytoskeleton organization protein [Ceraceosorus bombacis]
MSGSSSNSALAARQCDAIYNALDSSNDRKALTLADQLIQRTRSPSSSSSSSANDTRALASALRCIALVRLANEKADEALDEMLRPILHPTTTTTSSTSSSPRAHDGNVLHALCIALSARGRLAEEAEVACLQAEQTPRSLDLGKKAILACARASAWQKMHLLGIRYYNNLNKAAEKEHKEAVRRGMRSESDWFFWSAVTAYLLLDRKPMQRGAALALPLANRIVEQHLTSFPLGSTSEEEVWVAVQLKHRLALREGGSSSSSSSGHGLTAAALGLLTSSTGNVLVSKNLGLEELRRALREQVADEEAWRDVWKEGRAKLMMASSSSNWAHVMAVVRAAMERPAELLLDTQLLLASLAAAAASNDRTSSLTRLHFVSEARNKDLAGSLFPDASPQQAQQRSTTELRAAIEQHLARFSSLACTYQDLQVYAAHLPAQHIQQLSASWKRRLQSWPCKDARPILSDLKEMYTHLNLLRLALRFHTQRDAPAPASAEEEDDLETLLQSLRTWCLAGYDSALQLGKDVPTTEMQPADEYIYLYAQVLLCAPPSATRAPSAASILHLLALLARSLEASPKSYKLRILFVLLHRLLGADALAQEAADQIGIKGVQLDTLGWVFQRRLNVALGRGGKEQERVKRSKVYARISELYKENKKDLPKMIASTIENGTWSRVEEFVDFSERLERSISRCLFEMERIRAGGLDRVEVERVLKDVQGWIEDGLHDQRDFDILPAYTSEPIWDTISAARTCGAAKSNPGVSYVKAFANFCAITNSAIDANPKGIEWAELTSAERGLVELVNVSRTGTAGEIGQQLDSFLRDRNAEMLAASLPCQLLHNLAISLEALQALHSIKSSNTDLVAVLQGEALKGLLRELQASASETASRLSSEILRASDLQGSELLSPLAAPPFDRVKANAHVAFEQALEYLVESMQEHIDR